MIHVRASPADLDAWAYGACAGGPFPDCLPFYKRSETQLDETNPTAGKGGLIAKPLLVSEADAAVSGESAKGPGSRGLLGVVAIATDARRAATGPSDTTAPRAKAVTIEKDAAIHADATRSGNGGTVPLLSTSQTDQGGAISARGAGSLAKRA